MGQKLLILSARSYSFADKETGRNISGASMVVLDPLALPQDSPDNRGIKPADLDVQYSEVASLQLPGIYDVDYSIVAGKAGKAKPVVTRMVLLQKVDLFGVFGEDTPADAVSGESSTVENIGSRRRAAVSA